MNLETKDLMTALAFIVFGVLILLFPDILNYLVALALIIAGLAQLIPSSK